MIETLLEMLKKSNDYLSGEELGEKLGVSRAAIWKMIAKLKAMGYEIESSTKKGYRLFSLPDLLNQVEVQDGLNTKKIGHTIVFYEETTSTNDMARKLAEEGYPDGTVVIAEQQTGGKGRMGRQWKSQKGTGIWMSILLRPDIPPKSASKLTLIAGLCVCKAVRSVTGLEAGIKWPNDVLIGNKKICGILTEMNAEMDQIHSIVVGIGINVNITEFPDELQQKATSLYLASGKKFSRKEILQKTLEEWEIAYQEYQKDQNLNAFYQEYETYCITLNQEVQVIAKEPFFGKAIGLNPEGELIVEKENGEKVVVFSGEVSIRKQEL